jgi:hypothetical protein
LLLKEEWHKRSPIEQALWGISIETCFRFGYYLMFDSDFNGAAQIAADNDNRAVMDMPIPDPIVLEIKAFESELRPIVDDLMEHHWVADKISNGWNITPLVVQRAFKAHLHQQFEEWLRDSSADDLMHGTFGTKLQHEILEMIDKQVRFPLTVDMP